MIYDRIKVIEEMKKIARNPLPVRSETEISNLVRGLLRKMTVKEKIGQTYQSAFYGQFTYGPEFNNIDVVKGIKEGNIGSLLGLSDNEQIYQFQKLAVTESRLGIPLFFANDIIHGCRTGFPTNLAMASSFNPELVKEAAEVIAYESSHSGVNLTYSPMVDIVRDPRWGRVVESAGEDPYLGMKMAEAYVKGYEQDKLNDYNTVATCLKHFIGYGASEGGRDYNTVDFGERNLREIYLKPFKAGINAGSQMVMTAFNVYDGVPISANRYLLRDVLRNECEFNGVTISDYTATEEIIKHKIASSPKEVAKLCLKAGTDIEMIATTYIDTLEEQVNNDPELAEYLEEAVYRILVLKYKLGLFDNPYKNIYYNNEEHWLKPEFRAKSLQMAEESIVLLENNGVLPLKGSTAVALIGPYANNRELVGPWGGKARDEDCVTLFEGMKSLSKKVLHIPWNIQTENLDEKVLRIIEQTKDVEIVCLTIGESQNDSGEARSKTDIGLPFVQQMLLDALIEAGRKIVLVVFAGRPLILSKYVDNVEAIVYGWYLGSEMGNALARTIYGLTNPSGKLPISFPRSIGQIPVYYNHLNTGRPLDMANLNDIYKTRYIDSPNSPLYAFGHGMTYSKFEYNNLKSNKSEIRVNDSMIIEFTITNTSNIRGKEVVQCYLEPVSFSVSRPVKQLIRFIKVDLQPKETKFISFQLTHQDFSYTNINYINTPENRKYLLYVGSASDDIRLQTEVKTNILK